MSTNLKIGNRLVGQGNPIYIVAEMSANHRQDFDQAARILQEAKQAGADAVKVQTYTPETMTIDCDQERFRIGNGTAWQGRTLNDLYHEAQMPWEWQPRLQQMAADLGLAFFSTPFDPTAVEFLQRMNVPAYKVASFEIVDLPLLRRIARTGKPVILSTGMATLAEIGEAVQALRESGTTQLALLKCTSAYPAPLEDMHLRTIPHLAEAFDLPVGLSDHTLDAAVPVVATVLGACIIEKHLTLSRTAGGPDSTFSLEPHEFKAMVDAVRSTGKAVGHVHYGTTPAEVASLVFRRSVYVVKDIKAGELFTSGNLGIIRPGFGLPPKHFEILLGKRASRDIKRGTPFSWDLL